MHSNAYVMLLITCSPKRWGLVTHCHWKKREHGGCYVGAWMCVFLLTVRVLSNAVVSALPAVIEGDWAQLWLKVKWALCDVPSLDPMLLQFEWEMEGLNLPPSPLASQRARYHTSTPAMHTPGHDGQLGMCPQPVWKAIVFFFSSGDARTQTLILYTCQCKQFVYWENKALFARD